MSTPVDPPIPAAPTPVLNADLVFEALGFVGRRLLIQSLAIKRSATAAEIVPHGVLKRDATSKQLQELVHAGLATMKPDATDARRMRYTLLPTLQPVKHPDGHWELDFGCCLIRWNG